MHAKIASVRSVYSRSDFYARAMHKWKSERNSFCKIIHFNRTHIRNLPSYCSLAQIELRPWKTKIIAESWAFCINVDSPCNFLIAVFGFSITTNKEKIEVLSAADEEKNPRKVFRQCEFLHIKILFSENGKFCVLH